MPAGNGHRTGRAAAAAALVSLIACGGGGGNPSGPGGGGGGGGGGAVVGSTNAVGAIGATITISGGAVSPSTVAISVGQSVRFVNNNGRTHEMASDPHPTHTNCPSMANVGTLANGQTKDTFGFAAAGSCGFHDHNDPDNGSLRGRINIQ